MTSLRQRLILGTLLGISVVLAANGLAIYLTVRAQLRTEMDQALASQARATAERVVLELQRPALDSEQALLSSVDITLWDPDAAAPEDAPQRLWDSIRTVSPHASAIQVSGLVGPRQAAPELIRMLGRSSICVARLGADREASRAEVEALVRAAVSGDVDVAVLGSGAIASQDWSVEELLALALEVRGRVPEDVALTACEPREVWLAAPELVEALDLVHARLRPYDSGVPVEQAVGAIACWVEELTLAARGRDVVASDVGWPWAGEVVGGAVPSPENALRFLTEFTAWARLNGVSYVYSASDEPWSPSGDGATGAARGILEADGTFKPWVRALLDTGVATAGPPQVVLTGVPELGLQGDLLGAVHNVGTFDHRVVVYIRSQGAWWNKPSFAAPITAIHCDGTWAADVTTGEGDEYADALAAFLVPAGYTPPFLEGANELPAELYAVALDVSEVRR